MNSGLYALAGDSATATAAAWANRFDEPMTNVSKVYFGLSRLPPSPAGRGRSSRWCSPTWALPSLITRPGPLSGGLSTAGPFDPLGSLCSFGAVGLGTGTIATTAVGAVNALRAP